MEENSHSADLTRSAIALDRIRNEYNVSQAEIGKAIGRSQSTVYRTLQGGHGTSTEQLALVARTLINILERRGFESFPAKSLLAQIESSRIVERQSDEDQDLDPKFKSSLDEFMKTEGDEALDQSISRLNSFINDPAKYAAHAKRLLPLLKTAGTGYRRYRRVAHQARDAISLLEGEAKGEFVMKAAVEMGWAGVAEPGEDGIGAAAAFRPGGKDWIDFEERRSRAIMSARTRMALLRWADPYRGQWLTFTSKEFYGIFCPSALKEPGDLPGVEPILSDGYFTKGNVAEHGQDQSKEGAVGAVGPGIPEHGCFGDHYFIIDRRRDALQRLHKQAYKGGNGSRELTHRIRYVAPRFLCRLIDRKALAYDGRVVVSDFAPTALDSVLTLSPMSYFASQVGTHGVGADCYGPSGRREFDGLNLVAEDGRWMLFRSNHAAKPLFVAVLLVSNDDELVFAMGGTNALEKHLCWTPTAMGFAIPEDFDGLADKGGTSSSDSGKRSGEIGGDSEKSYPIVNGIEEAAKRILLQRLPFLADDPEAAIKGSAGRRREKPLKEAKKALSVTVAGYAQDAALGMQPCFFCIARTEKYSAKQIHERAGRIGDPLRTHRLISGDPNVSLAEMFGQQRYRNSELLRAHVFFAWKMFIELRPPKTGGDPEDVAGDMRTAPLKVIGKNGDKLLPFLEPSGDQNKLESGKKLGESDGPKPESIALG